MVGTSRFELPTSRTPSECATKLRYVPKNQGCYYTRTEKRWRRELEGFFQPFQKGLEA